ncbi:MAG: glycosyltransferase family 39 protein [Lachnospiraceae bacterium]|nr:glycosyltransferase family 39 protein [Lachnospiraceae bacterium]
MNHLSTWKQKVNTFPLQKALPFVLLLLGALLRIIRLSEVPGGYHQDEAFVALNAFGLFHEGMDSAGLKFPIYMSSWGDGQSAMYSWLLTPLLLFTKGVPTLFVTRIPQVLISVLTLWCVYHLIKRMFGETSALWALFLLTICPWHVMMSRWGLDANMAPGFLMFALYFFVLGLENNKYLPISALFYGLSLYCYAVVWTIVPIIIVLQIVHGLYHKRLSFNKWAFLSAGILFFMALPLILFVLINGGYMEEIALPFLTIPRTPGYRGAEVSFSYATMWANLKNAGRLFLFQNTGSPYDILLPWGLFYDIGRLFIIAGAVCLICKVIVSTVKKQFCYEYYIFTNLLGGALICLFTSVKVHQANALFIPLVLCEGYGVWKLLAFLKSKKPVIKRVCSVALISIYLLCLTCFQFHYYSSYKELVNAYFCVGLEDCVDYALEQCEETGLSTISAEKGTQWPRLLLFTETLPSRYISTREFDVAPAPGSFITADGILVKTRINYETINDDTIYIIYYTDVEKFWNDFQLTQFHDWFVAVPK